MVVLSVDTVPTGQALVDWQTSTTTCQSGLYVKTLLQVVVELAVRMFSYWDQPLPVLTNVLQLNVFAAGAA